LTRRSNGVLMALLLTVVVPGVCADDEVDYREARRLRDSGEVLPLETVLARVREQQAGKVLGVEFEHEHGRWIYEIAVLAPDGSVWEFEVDAANGEFLEREREY